MSKSLEGFLIDVISKDTIEEERVVISNELATLRTFMKDCDEHYKPRVIAKIAYLNMIGENTGWGEMEVVNMMANPRTSFKRIGYIAAGIMFDENNERMVLITHTMQKDLTSDIPNVQILPLILLANMGSEEMCQSLASDVQNLLDSPSFRIQKAAIMASCHILRKVPDLTESFKPYIQKIFNSSFSCNISAGISLALIMAKIDPSLVKDWEIYASPMTRRLKQQFDSRPTQEFQFSVFNNPFLQIKIMQFLQLLKAPSEELDDLLAAISTNVDVRRNTGRSVLFQSIQTVGTAAHKSSLKSLAFNQVGRLFAFREPNVLYSALSAFGGILFSSALDRTSADAAVLQRYKTAVVGCLDHRDPSIRRRALDVVTALVDEGNVQELVPEILQYLRLAEGDFRVEMTAKVFQAAMRFSRSAQWSLETAIRILAESGGYAGPDVVRETCRLVGTHPNLRFNACQILGGYVRREAPQPLLQVAAWVLGEFHEVNDDTIKVLARILQMPQTTSETKGYIMVAIAKIGARTDRTCEVKNILSSLINSNSLEIQQRAGELVHILERPQLAEELLAPLEFEEIKDDAIEGVEGNLLIDEGITEKPSEKKEIDPVAALLGSAPVRENQDKPKSDTDDNKKVPPNLPPGAKEAWRTSDYVLYFQVQVNKADPRQVAIRASVYGLGAIPLTQFTMQYGLPRGWVLAAQQPSSNVLEPAGGPPIVQLLMLQNRGELPLQMRALASYLYRSQPLKEQGPINPSVFA